MESQHDDAPPVLVLARLGTVMRRAFAARMATEPWASDAGLRPGSYSILRAVAGADAPPSQRDLSDQLGIDPSDLVGLIDVLEQAGFLTRERHPHDRRRHALRVTTDGAAALGHFDRVASTVANDVFGVLAASDRSVLEDLLGQVVAAHEADSTSATA